MTTPPRALRRICLVGVSGLGKTTLLRAAAPRLPGYHCLFGSALLRELAGEEFTRFDHLHPERRQHFREQAIRHMEHVQQEHRLHILCDGHLTLRSRATGRLEPVSTALDRGFYRELVLLEAEAPVVATRRAADPERRRTLDLDAIQEELTAEHAECRQVAAAHCMRLHELDAAGDGVVERLVALLEAG